ncbi:MAG: MEDS domain-containing protein, partial [Actinomycetota bacterium]|nr:MEDS domain-containing protein [Actinomycetota bacterium]
MTAAFRHEALFYDGLDGFMDGLLPFVRAGVAAGEPTLVAVEREKIEALSGALGEEAGAVDFVDMRAMGRNPGCIIPLWRAFVAEHAGDGGGVRGVGEPIWAGRSAAELDECHRHEALLNVAFDDGPPWKLVCPYDAGALPAEVVEEARRTHPYVGTDSVTGRSDDYLGGRYETLAGELPPPPARREEVRFTRADLATVRTLFVASSFTASTRSA